MNSWRNKLGCVSLQKIPKTDYWYKWSTTGVDPKPDTLDAWSEAFQSAVTRNNFNTYRSCLFPSPKSWIIRARRQKETGNQPRLKTFNLNIILTCNIYKELSVTKWNYSHFIHNLPVTQEIRYSFKFRCVGPACYWHDALWPLLRIAWLLPTSGPVEQSSVEVTSKFCPFHL